MKDRSRRRAHGRLGLAGVVFMLALLLPVAALAAFPGTNPDESVRINTPSDPEFDRCEPHLPGEGAQTCTNPFDQEIERFGFAPNTTQRTAVYRNDGCESIETCQDPHTLRLEQQNQAAGRNPAGQVSGVSADRAWKYSIGHPSVQVAILDTGIRWNNLDLRAKIGLNRNELPLPQGSGAYDRNADGAFNVDDYAGQVPPSAGNDEADAFLDASDLIAVFSDGADEDSNGYIDDIAGWDFFDDDNDPYDVSSYAASQNHGTSRAEEAAQQTNDLRGGTGVCPRCQVVPMRVWDTFVVDVNNFALATLYAAENEIEVVEGAVGGLSNPTFARRAFDYAYRHGTFMTIVSSDLNTANHNLPTLYDEALQVQGSVADVHGLGEDYPNCPGFPGCQQFRDFLLGLGIPSSVPVGTWFRNSGTTQYGGHAHVVMPAPTGSQATGQASGAVGLLISFARQKGTPLEPNEVKQLLTLTAEDVVPENTLGSGVPDPSQPGWDQHFGYGRPDLGLAMQRIDQGALPPQALITSPEWFAPFNALTEKQLEIRARLSARTGNYAWELQFAPGIEPAEGEFVEVDSGAASEQVDGALGNVDLSQVRAALDARPGGGSTVDPTAPSKGPGDVDPNEPAFTVRVIVTDAQGRRAEDRKVLFAHRDHSLHQGWSREIVSGGEASQRMFDLDGDNDLEIVEATSAGDLHVLRADGTPLPSFNGGQPVTTLSYPNSHPGRPSAEELGSPPEVLRTPAIGDIDGDMEPEIVDSAGEHVYAWESDGSAVDGFPVRLDPAFSPPGVRTKANHIKRGFISSPALGDLDGDGDLEIAVAGLDQRLYVWRGNGSYLPGFPVYLREPDEPCDSDFPCAESVNTPSIADISGDDRPELVVATNEISDPQPVAPPGDPNQVGNAFRTLLVNILAGQLGGGPGRIYAVHNDGHQHGGGPFLDGWPVKPVGALPGVLPLAGPGLDTSLGDVSGDGVLDVIGGLTSGETQAFLGSGDTEVVYDSQPGSGEHVDRSKILNLFSYPIAANFDGIPGLEVLQGGFTLNQVLNLGVTVGQNLPYNHLLQGWNGQTGASLPSFPQAVEDYQLLSTPAIADVSQAPGAEAVLGTGLYLLRGINAAGVEAPGWPKFTGGWIFAVPAMGDADGDGLLEVSVVTREGFSFLWDTDRRACAGNDQWWTSRHDEWNTGAYTTDSRPPGSPRDLTATKTKGGGTTLAWIAPGGDWLCGEADVFRVIRARSPIEHPTDGTVVFPEQDATAGSGARQTVTLTAAKLAGAKYVAVLYRDESGNWGLLKSAAVAPPGGRGGPGVDDVPDVGSVPTSP